MSTNSQRYGNSPGRPNVNTRSNALQVQRPPTVHRAAPRETPITLRPIVVDRLVTTRQAAAMLGFSTETLKKWRPRPGKGPNFIRYPGGSIRYHLRTIMKFIEDHVVEP
jgi:hypothetical protein